MEQPHDIGGLTDSIVSGAREIRVDLSVEQAALMARHLLAVLAHSAVTNLTAIHDLSEAVVLHVLDSLSAVPSLVGGGSQGAFCDLGAGAGYPGIPLAIATGRHGVLLEANGKKAAFLGGVVFDLSLDCEVVAERSEMFAGRAEPAFESVVCRAVAPLPVLVELASPLLRPGGRLVAMKGRPEEAELRAGRDAAAQAGMREVAITPVEVPGLHAARTLVEYERCGPCGVALPRRPGMAAKRPLG